MDLTQVTCVRKYYKGMGICKINLLQSYLFIYSNFFLSSQNKWEKQYSNSGKTNLAILLCYHFSKQKHLDLSQLAIVKFLPVVSFSFSMLELINGLNLYCRLLDNR